MSVHHMKVAAVAAVLALSAAAYADDADQANPDTKALLEYVKKLEGRVNQLEQEKQWPLDQLRSQSGSALESAVHAVNLSGYMEFQYGYNFMGSNGSSSAGHALNANQLAGSSNDNNGFSFQNLQLLADKPLTTVNSTGFRVRAEYGDQAQFDNRDPNFSTSASSFYVREAYMSWRAGIGGMGGSMDHVDLSIGQMDTPLGIETPDATTNWLVTRSFQHNLATPITHTGARVALPWSECCTSSVYVVNGWDNTRNANGAKTVILSQQMGPFDQMKSSFTANVSYGDEGSISTGTGAGASIGPQSNKTLFGELIWRAQIDESDKIAVDGFWAKQNDGAFNGRGTIMTRYYNGGSAYIRHQMNKTTWFAARGEYYADDALGQPTGILRVVGLSVAAGWDLAADLQLVIEYRHDHALTGDPFVKSSSGAPEDDQDRVTASVVYRF